MKPWQRPRPKTTFMHVREHGQVLAHLYRISSTPVVQPPTAEIADYPPATQTEIELNQTILSGDGVCKALKKSLAWREELGVVALSREEYVPTRAKARSVCWRSSGSGSTTTPSPSKGTASTAMGGMRSQGRMVDSLRQHAGQR